MDNLRDMVWAAAWGSLYAQTADSIIHSKGATGHGFYSASDDSLSKEGKAYCDAVASRAANLAKEGFEERLASAEQARQHQLRKGLLFGG